MWKNRTQPFVGVVVLIAGIIPWAGCGPAHLGHHAGLAWIDAPAEQAAVSSEERVWRPVVPEVPARQPARPAPALAAANTRPGSNVFPMAPAPAVVRQTGSHPAASPIEPAVLHVNTSNFDQHVLAAEVPVLVDFYADWCGPCRTLAPTLEQVAAENPQARVVKINIDHSPELAARYGVKSVPRLLVFKDGQIAAQQTGAVSKTKLNALLAL